MGYYDMLSKGYDELYGEEQREKYEFVKEWLDSLQGTILDVGSGTGIICEFIKPTVLTDSSLGMLSKAEGTRIVCDARYLPFKNKCFDNSTCFTVLQDVYEKQRVVDELTRVTKSKIIITILKKLKSRESIEQLFKGFSVEYREQERDHCFLLSNS